MNLDLKKSSGEHCTEVELKKRVAVLVISIFIDLFFSN